MQSKPQFKKETKSKISSYSNPDPDKPDQVTCKTITSSTLAGFTKVSQNEIVKALQSDMVRLRIYQPNRSQAAGSNR